MSAKFTDSNVLLYIGGSDARKAAVAEGVLAARPFISVQVLNEAANVARKKHRKSWSEIGEFLYLIRAAVQVEPLTVAIHEEGLRLAERYGFSIYDSLIIAAALSVDCDTLWSEDMQHGMIVDGTLTIRNPFLS